jgi:diguanylate cyclase (GGDEF)-like protein
MVIAVPRNDHLGALKRTALNNAGIATLAVLLAIVMGLWFSHRIGSDVHRLSEATRLLAQGEAPKPLYVERSDELGVIARSMRELSSALLTDPLTGVLNRATFEKRANAELDRQRIGVATASAALVFIDLNAFKRINDSHGHSVGDAVLALAAQRLSRALRTGDFMGRLGGDEFVLFLHEVADLSGARQVIERCRSQLATPIAVAGIDTRIDAAFGLAMIPADGRTLAALLAHADEDMYRDKPQQRHTYKQIDRRTPHSTRQSIDSQKNRLAARNQQIHRYHGHLA